MTESELQKLKELCAAATAGRWECAGIPVDDGYFIGVGTYNAGTFKKADAEFITQARTAIPLLIAEVELLDASHKDAMMTIFAFQEATAKLEQKLAIAKEALEFIPDLIIVLENPDSTISDVSQFTNEAYEAKKVLEKLK